MGDNVSSSSWTSFINTPSILLIESLESLAFYRNACHEIDPSLVSSTSSTLLQQLCDKSIPRRVIDYLTPTMRFSRLIRFHFVPAPQFPFSSIPIEKELHHTVVSHPPSPTNINFPWYFSFRETLFSSTLLSQQQFVETSGSTLHLPLAAIFVASAEEDDPIYRLRYLASLSTLPTTIPRFYLVVTTNVADHQRERAERTRSEFGEAYCIILQLHTERAFEESFHQVMERIVKATQNRMFALNDSVSQQRRGISNTFRSFFGNGGPPPPSPSQANDSIQTRTRLLADLLLMMHDYEGAIHMYTYLQNDYTREGGGDTHLLRLGNAFEMAALCHFLLSSIPLTPQQQQQAQHIPTHLKRSELLLEKAIETYSRLPNAKQMSSPLLLLRCVLLYLEVTPNPKSPTVLKLLRRVLALQDSELCVAVGLEQCFHFQTTTMRRKAVFDLLRAGSIYKSLDMHAHAQRCYLFVYHSFKHTQWYAAEHHLLMVLGTLALSLGDVRQVVQFRGLLLERGLHLNAAGASSSRALLDEFLSAAAATSDVRRLEFALPKVMACDLAPSVQYFAEESISISLRIRNPLQTELELKDLHVFDASNGMVTSHMDTVTLLAMEERTLFLTCHSPAPGTVTIHGVLWELGDGGIKFQYLLPKPIQVQIKDRAARLEATCVVSLNTEHDDVFEIHLTNTGASDMDTNFPWQFHFQHVGEVGISKQVGYWNAVEVSDDRGLVLSLPSDPVPVGSSVILFWKRFTPRTSTTFTLHYDGRRSVDITLPPILSTPPQVVCQARIVHKREIYLELKSISSLPIRPLACLCLSTKHWEITPIVEDDTSSEPSTEWSLVFRLTRRADFTTSQVVLNSNSLPPPLLDAVDFRLRCHHAAALFEERECAKRRVAEERAMLEATGKFPVTIQDVRRARLQQVVATSALTTSFPPGSMEAISMDSADCVHLALEWEANNVMQRTYICRVPVLLPPLLLSILGVVPTRVYLKPDEAYATVDLKVRVENRSESQRLHNVAVTIGRRDFPADRFPRPACWLGATHKGWQELMPGEARDLTISALFVGSGVYLLGPIEAECTLLDGTVHRVQLMEERFVSVLRGGEDDAGKQDVFQLVQQELNDDNFL